MTSWRLRDLYVSIYVAAGGQMWEHLTERLNSGIYVVSESYMGCWNAWQLPLSARLFRSAPGICSDPEDFAEEKGVKSPGRNQSWWLPPRIICAERMIFVFVWSKTGHKQRRTNTSIVWVHGCEPERSNVRSIHVTDDQRPKPDKPLSEEWNEKRGCIWVTKSEYRKWV